MNTTVAPTQTKVNWTQVGLFLGLTFAFTALADLLALLGGGYGKNSVIPFFQLQMMLPAFFAMLLGLFAFKDSPFYFRKPMPDGKADRGRGFCYFYLALTVVFAIAAVLSAFVPSAKTLASNLILLVLVVTVLAWIGFRLFKGCEGYARADLRTGRIRDWLIYGLAFVVLMALQAAGNALFGLGTPVDADALAAEAGIQMRGLQFLATTAFLVIVVNSFLGLALGFGEEYGWRTFLQDRLIRLGKVRGIFLLGLIWGAWHWPMIWMGHNYPGYPISGSLAMLGVCVPLSYLLGYVMLKTRSIWLVAFLHCVIDQANSFFMLYVYKASDPMFSFWPGIFGIAMSAVVTLLVLRDPVWKETPAAPAVPALAPTA